MGSVTKDLGSILLGGLISLLLSGIVMMQAWMYFRTYKKDFARVRITVAIVVFLDILHSSLICAGNWRYLIIGWGDEAVIDFIPMSIALTVLSTALITFAVQTFFTHRVLVLSKRNWFMVIPMHLFALIRLVSAAASTGLMIQFRSYERFVDGYAWVFTIGLSTSMVVDVLVTLTLCYYLRISRTGFSSAMDHVVDTIMLYTINNGSLTCLLTIFSLIFWIILPHNLIFLGFHFAISKLYANSFLATLNTRETLRERSQGSSQSGTALPVIFPRSQQASNHQQFTIQDHVNAIDSKTTKLQVQVERTIRQEIEEDDAEIEFCDPVRRSDSDQGEYGSTSKSADVAGVNAI